MPAASSPSRTSRCACCCQASVAGLFSLHSISLSMSKSSQEAHRSLLAACASMCLYCTLLFCLSTL